MRIVLTPLAKSVLILSAIDAAIQKKQKQNWIRHDSVNSFKRRNGKYHENNEIS